MPQYLMLIYAEPGAGAAPPKAWEECTAALAGAGVLRGGAHLHPTDAATTVRVRDGELQLTDGPFAETKEELAGYYLVETADLDEALAYAARVPSAPFGSVEVRPLVEPAG